jgi:Tetratricopeptide repeat/Glycosyltransferase family 9 (heptosyltransferase)
MTSIDRAMQIAVRHHQAGELQQAEAVYRQVLATQPTHITALHFLGLIAQQSGHADGIDLMRHAIAAGGDDPNLHNNLGNALLSWGKWNEAIESCRRAITLQPNFPEAIDNLGCALRAIGNLDEAISCFRQAITLQPNSPAPHLHLAMALLLLCQWEEGWREYEWRRRLPEYPKAWDALPQPQWDGSPLAGRRIILYAEQGLGDTIQFLRFIPLVQKRGGQVLLFVQPELHRLLEGENSFGAELLHRARPQDPPTAQFDTHLPLLSLPLVLNESAPAASTDLPQPPYIRPKPALTEQWQIKSAALKVGLTWAGRPKHTNDRHRSIPLAMFAPLAHNGIEFYSLQLNAPPAPAPMPMIDRTAEFQDFADTSALIEQMDLVVTVDTAVAHLAGAMGKKTWLLLPFKPDFRWRLDRDDTPWYPTMRLFRQPRPGDWNEPISRLARELHRLAVK